MIKGVVSLEDSQPIIVSFDQTVLISPGFPLYFCIDANLAVLHMSHQVSYVSCRSSSFPVLAALLIGAERRVRQLSTPE